MSTTRQAIEIAEGNEIIHFVLTNGAGWNQIKATVLNTHRTISEVHSDCDRVYLTLEGESGKVYGIAYYADQRVQLAD